MGYILKHEYAHRPVLITTIGNKAVNLGGKEVKKITPATRDEPERETIIPPATQEELKILFESGNPCIEYVEDKKEDKKESK